MTLQDFVSQALHQIMLGVRDAQLCTTAQDRGINPRLHPARTQRLSAEGVDMVQTDGGELIVTTTVECDLAVTVPTGTTPSAGGNARLLTVVPVHDHTAPTTMNRLRFKVPVMLPTQALAE